MEGESYWIIFKHRRLKIKLASHTNTKTPSESSSELVNRHIIKLTPTPKTRQGRRSLKVRHHLPGKADIAPILKFINEQRRQASQRKTGGMGET